MIAAKYNTSEGKVQILPVLRTMAAVIVARRRNRNNEQRRREQIFLVLWAAHVAFYFHSKNRKDIGKLNFTHGERDYIFVKNKQENLKSKQNLIILQYDISMSRYFLFVSFFCTKHIINYFLLRSVRLVLRSPRPPFIPVPVPQLLQWLKNWSLPAPQLQLLWSENVWPSLGQTRRWPAAWCAQQLPECPAGAHKQYWAAAQTPHLNTAVCTCCHSGNFP